MKTPTIFSAPQLDATIAKVIPAQLPDGHKNAIVAGVDTDGAHVAALISLGKKGNWQVKAAGEYAWTGDVSVGAQLVDSW